MGDRFPILEQSVYRRIDSLANRWCERLSRDFLTSGLAQTPGDERCHQRIERNAFLFCARDQPRMHRAWRTQHEPRRLGWRRAS